MAYIGNSPDQNVRETFFYTATAGQTTFSGADLSGSTLNYQDGKYVDVYLNGIALQNGTDYTALTKTSVTLTAAAQADDLIQVTAFGIFAVSDTVSKVSGGTFTGAVTFSGGVTNTGTATGFGGATGGGTDDVFYENSRTVATSYSITAGKSASCVGPLTINSGITVTIPSGERLVIL